MKRGIEHEREQEMQTKILFYASINRVTNRQWILRFILS